MGEGGAELEALVLVGVGGVVDQHAYAPALQRRHQEIAGGADDATPSSVQLLADDAPRAGVHVEGQQLTGSAFGGVALEGAQQSERSQALVDAGLDDQLRFEGSGDEVPDEAVPQLGTMLDVKAPAQVMGKTLVQLGVGACLGDEAEEIPARCSEGTRERIHHVVLVVECVGEALRLGVQEHVLQARSEVVAQAESEVVQKPVFRDPPQTAQAVGSGLPLEGEDALEQAPHWAPTVSTVDWRMFRRIRRHAPHCPAGWPGWPSPA